MPVAPGDMKNIARKFSNMLPMSPPAAGNVGLSFSSVGRAGRKGSMGGIGRIIGSIGMNGMNGVIGTIGMPGSVGRAARCGITGSAGAAGTVGAFGAAATAGATAPCSGGAERERRHERNASIARSGTVCWWSRAPVGVRASQLGRSEDSFLEGGKTPGQPGGGSDGPA